MQLSQRFVHLLTRDMYSVEPREKLRVVFVNHTAQPGGGEIALCNLLRSLDPSIEALVVLCADGPLVEQLRMHHPVHVLPISASIGEARRESIGWKSILRWRNVIFGVAYILRLSRYFRQLRPRYIHTNSLKSHIIGGAAGWIAGVPVIWHMRDRIAPDYLPPSAVSLVRFLSGIIPRFIIANSVATLNTVIDPRMRGSKGNLNARCRVIHDGCEVPSMQSPSDQSDPVAVGLIGRISPWKGQHIFIQAAAMIRDEFPNVRFRIIGAPLFSETEYESEVKQLARDLSLDDRVEFTGFVHDVQSALAKLQIVVHASTVGEPFGQVVIEGMAAGKPVIATDGGGIPEIVVDRATGLLVKMNDASALAEAMASLLRDPMRAQAMGARGRERVRKLFTIERTANAVEQVYREVLTAAPAGARL
jgi:glycosyltransferase involved in cell wall biosynthesis